LGDLSGPALVGPLIAREVLESGYSRSAEVDADNYAITLLDRAGISRQGLIDFFQRAAEAEDKMPGALSYLSTHPSSAERIRNLQENMSHANERMAFSEADWEVLKGACEESAEL